MRHAKITLLSSWFMVATLFVGCQESTPMAPQSATSEAVAATKEATKNEGATKVPVKKQERWVVLGGSVTELVYALGGGEHVVAVDVTSTYPEEAKSKAQVGYFRKLSAEAILSLKPTRIIASDQVGPKSTLDQLKASGVVLDLVPSEEGLEGATQRIRTVGKLLSKEKSASALVQKVEREVAHAQKRGAALRAQNKAVPRVLFLYARGANMLMVAGKKTSAFEMVKLAGVDNAVDGFEGFKPLNPESLIAAAPDVVVIPSDGAKTIGGDAGVFDLPGMKSTPAGQNKRLVKVDGLKFLGFGPRMGEALLELQDAVGVPLHESEKN